MEERRYAGDAACMQGMQMSYQTFSLSLVSFVFEAQQTARDSYCPDVDMNSESAASRTSHTDIATIFAGIRLIQVVHVSCFSANSLYACFRLIGGHTLRCITVGVSIIPPPQSLTSYSRSYPPDQSRNVLMRNKKKKKNRK